jgi:hypothetical protein
MFRMLRCLDLFSLFAVLTIVALFADVIPAAADSGRVYQEIELPWPTEQERAVLGTIPDLEVLKMEKGEWVRFLSRPELTQQLRDAGLAPTVRIEDYVAYHDAQRGLRASFDGLYTYAQTVAYLDSLHAEYPSLMTAKDSIGTSWEGRTIWAVKVSDNPDVNEDEPEVLFDALHHAREPIGVSVLLDLLRHLCENYGSDPEATFLVNEREMWFVPVMNPDGYVYNETSGGDMMWRKNRRDNPGSCEGVDLNRNYGYHWGEAGSSADPCNDTYHGPSAFSEPETQALRDFILAHDFVVQDSYHSVVGVILYPWGYTTSPAPDQTTFHTIGEERNRDSGYEVGQAASLLYLASGVTFDWAYAEKGILSYTTEVGGSGFWPSVGEIPGLVSENLYSNIYLSLVAGSYVRLADSQITGGNGNGRLDPGETANLIVTLENPGVQMEATDVTVVLASDDAYVQIDDAESDYGTIPAGGSAGNSSDPFVVTLDAATPSGHVVALHLTMTWGGAFTNEESILFTIGEPILADDFESGNNGWSQDPTHTATTGDWVIIDPNGTAYQPEDDTTPPPGTMCWVTGQNTALGTDDVDGGISALRSPTWDLSAFSNVQLLLNYFHGQRDPGDDPSGDFFRIDLSNDGGATFPANLVSIGDVQHAAIWTPLAVELSAHLPLTDQIVLRFQASDGPATGDIVEGGLDDFVLLEGGSANEPPSAPTLLSPANGATVSSAPVLTVVNAVDPEGDPLTYGFHVYSDALLTSPVRMVSGVPEGTGQTAWAVAPPLGGGNYWWRAYAEDAEERGPFMARASFTVEATGVEALPAATLTFFPPSPNPAREMTTVRFVLPQQERVRADVFDVNGRRVRSLFRGLLPAGAQALSWDGLDQRGARAAAGVYFVRLRVGGEERVLKVVRMR